MKKIISILLLVVLLLTGCAQAKEAEVVNTITTDLKTYYELSDGTWQADDRNYKYRLEITGRMDNAAEDSTFIFLSNIEKISFNQAWKAAGLSSNKADYFSVEEAILVEWRSVNSNPISQTSSSAVDANNSLVVKPDNLLDAAISDAILETYCDVIPDGTLNSESHIILTNKAITGASADKSSNSCEEAVAVYYLILQYGENDGELEELRRLWGEAVIVFAVDESGKYSVKDFLRPQYSADYDEDLLKLLATANETDKEQYERQLLENCKRTAEEYLANKEAAFSAQPG